MSKIRLSFSLMSAIKYGRRDDVVRQYLRIYTEPNENMKRGLDFDRMVEAEVDATKKFPKEFNSLQLTAPVCKLQATVSYDERFDIKGELDIWDLPVIYEVKNSITKDSAEYSDTGQLDIYFLLSELVPKDHPLSKADRAWLYRFDPIHHTYDTSLIWKSQRRIQAARDMVENYGPQVYEILKSEGIIND